MTEEVAQPGVVVVVVVVFVVVVGVVSEFSRWEDVAEAIPLPVPLLMMFEVPTEGVDEVVDEAKDATPPVPPLSRRSFSPRVLIAISVMLECRGCT